MRRPRRPAMPELNFGDDSQPMNSQQTQTAPAPLEAAAHGNSGTLDSYSLQRQQWNLQALQMARFLQREGLQADGARRQVLQRFTGEGGITSSQESRGQYLTPYIVCKLLTRLISIRPGSRILDPTCGSGRFAEYLPDGCSFTGIEIDPAAAAIARALYPAHEIITGDILEHLHHREAFDVVTGNPPFGLWWKVDALKSNVASAAGKVLSQWKTLEASIIAVKKGGVIGLVIPQNSFTNDRAADQRAAAFWHSNCIVRAEIDLPGKAFKSSGTEWPCSMIIIQRPPAPRGPVYKFAMSEIQEAPEIIKQFQRSEAFKLLQATQGPLVRDRRDASKMISLGAVKWRKEKEAFRHIWEGQLPTETEEDIVYLKRSGHQLVLKPNGVIAALKLEAWKEGTSGYYNSEMWKKKCTVDNLVFKDTLNGFAEAGLKTQVDPEFLLYLKGKRKFYNKENFKMGDVPKERQAQYKKNLARLERLNLWDKLFPYQRHDAAIHAIKNFSFLGYEQGLGKTRTAIAIAMLKGTKSNLFICYSRLVHLWRDEMVKMGINPRDINIIRHPHDLDNTKLYNIISFESLRHQDRPNEPVICEMCGSEVKGKICMAPNKDAYGDKKTCGWNRFKDATCPQCGNKHVNANGGIEITESQYTGHYCHDCGYVDAVWQPGIYKRMRHLFSFIAVDESQASKNRNSQQGRALRTLKAKHKLILTGTILENYVSEAFWQLWWLLGASCRFPYPYEGGHNMFVNRFCEFTETKSGRRKMLPSIQNEAIFYEMMDSLMTRRTCKDSRVKKVIDLPDYTEKRVHVTPASQEMALYEQALNDFENWYRQELSDLANKPYWMQGETKKKLSALVLVKLNALRKVSSCPYTFSGWNQKNIPAKMRFVKGIVDKKIEAGEKVLIFSAFKSAVAYMLDKLPQADGFTGEMPIPRRNQIMQRFQTQPDPRVLVATTQCCNLGVTLTKASTCIIYDLLWSPKQLEQAWKRIHRVGQDKECEIIYLINQNMIDDDINQLVSDKDAAINKAIDRIETDGAGEMLSPMDFANKMLEGRGRNWIKKYLEI